MGRDRWITDGASGQEQPKVKRGRKVRSDGERKRSKRVGLGRKRVMGRSVGTGD